MARISLTPSRTLSYRIAEWFIRRQFGAMLDPVRATGHNIPILRAFGALEQRAAKWNALDVKIRDLADMAAAAEIGCSWCLDFGYWMMHTHGISREKIEAVPQWRSSKVFDPIERLVLEFAEGLTETPPTVDDELVRKLQFAYKFVDDGWRCLGQPLGKFQHQALNRIKNIAVSPVRDRLNLFARDAVRVHHPVAEVQ